MVAFLEEGFVKDMLKIFSQVVNDLHGNNIYIFVICTYMYLLIL